MLLALPCRGEPLTEPFSFANGTISCEVLTPGFPLPDSIRKGLPLAMNTALDQVGPPQKTARLAIHLQPPPSLLQRSKAWLFNEAFSSQRGDEIQIPTEGDDLKVVFRLAHELSHWLVYKQYPARPPLWLDEGLAQRTGALAADTCARTQTQKLERPPPGQLSRNLFTLDELLRLQAYPKGEARSAAFYWQAEALVNALHSRLGPAEFKVYLGLLSSTNAPDWQTPLRERWYFSDWDFNWIAQQIRTTP